MTKVLENGGPAFPRDHAHDGHNGMSLRDYFAAKALQGMLACPTQPPSMTVAAQDAYYVADAMLVARETQSSNGYAELLFSVSKKYPGETRHQTALRYIRQADAGPQQETDALYS